MNFGELKTSIQRYIIDDNVSVVDEINDVVNEAVRRMQDNHNFKVFESKTALLETTLVTRKLNDVPSDFKMQRSRPYLVDNSGNTIPIGWAPNDFEMDKIYEESNSAIDKGQPRFIFLFSKSTANVSPYFEFHVFPFPDGLSDYTNGNWRIICPYWRYLPLLVSAADTNFILNTYPLAIRFQCIAQLHWLNIDEERAAIWEGKADKMVREAKRADRRKQFVVGSDDTLRIRSGVSDPFNVHRR